MRPRRWVPDSGWTGDWALPDLLTRTLDQRDRDALVALSLRGTGPGRLARELAGVDCVQELARRWECEVDRGRVRELLSRSAARLVIPSDAEYPKPLRNISAPPPFLFVRGASLDSLGPMVAIVGARACTRGAARFGRRLGEAFAAAGFTVVSGLARGIDGAAHHGAVSTGRSLAVLGTGIDEVYPAEHRDLARAIVDRGAVVTEFPPGAGPRAWHFPARNRIVAGLSLAVVVVEAGLGSGALITAGFALEQGREVFACTVSPEGPAGAGVREMLREGARLVVDPGDAVAEVAELAAVHGLAPGPVSVGMPLARSSTGDLEGDDAVVYAAVTERSTVDELAETSGLDAGRVSTVLAGLELEGRVESDGQGGWYRVD